MESTKCDVFLINLLPCRATVEKAADNPCIDSLCSDAAIRGHQRRFRFATAFPYEARSRLHTKRWIGWIRAQIPQKQICYLSDWAGDPSFSSQSALMILHKKLLSHTQLTTYCAQRAFYIINIFENQLKWLQNSKHSFQLNDVQNLLPGKLEQNRELGPEFLKLLLWAQTASFRSWRPTTVRILKYKNAIKCLGNDSVRKLMWQNGINQELNAIWMWMNSQRDDGHIL